MIVYRPHVHGLDITTTPDLILEMTELSSDVQRIRRKASVAAAWVIVAAGYGPLLTVGLLDGTEPWIIARNAWRLADVNLDDLEIAFGGRSSPFAGDASAPAAGQARFVAASLPALADPETCDVCLFDRRLGRRISHCLQILKNQQ